VTHFASPGVPLDAPDINYCGIRKHRVVMNAFIQRFNVLNFIFVLTHFNFF